jgi:hypothetical protein
MIFQSDNRGRFRDLHPVTSAPLFHKENSVRA